MSNKVKKLSDIAHIAGVSTSTVSRALADSPLVNEQTKQKIKKIAEQHNYHLHLGARNLRIKRSSVVAVVLKVESPHAEALSDPFVLEFISAVGSALSESNYNLLLLQGKTLDQRYWCSGVVDGFIVLGRGRDHHYFNQIAGEVPFVIWGPKLPNQRYTSVGPDNVTASRQAVEHLIALGRKRIAIVTDDLNRTDTEAYWRYVGYLEALSTAGYVPDPKLIAHAGFDPQTGYSAISQLLAQAPDLDAVFAAYSDAVAIASIDALRKSGRHVPNDVAVVGFDNINLGRYCSVPLTTISQELYPKGVRLLVENLLNQINGHPGEISIFDGKLVIRQSCGARPVNS